MTKPVLGKTAVYRLYDEAGQVLYVGAGSDPAARWKDHATRQPWWPEVARKSVEWYDTEDEAWDAEADAVQNESPAYNRAKWRFRRSSRQAPREDAAMTLPSGILRRYLADRIDTAHFRHEPTVITVSGEPRAVLISYEEWAQVHDLQASDL